MNSLMYPCYTGTNTCGSIGDLPPITEDCQQIFNSITILNGSVGEAPYHTMMSDNVKAKKHSQHLPSMSLPAIFSS